jgi:hypothetical protein
MLVCTSCVKIFVYFNVTAGSSLFVTVGACNHYVHKCDDDYMFVETSALLYPYAR